MTCGIIWSQTVTSRLETLLILLKLHSIYFVLLLLRRKSCVSKVRLQISNLLFKPLFDSTSKTISSTKSMHLSVRSRMCSMSTSKIKEKIGVYPPRVCTLDDIPSYISWIARIYAILTPFISRDFHKISRHTVSYTYSKSCKSNCSI